MVVALVGGVLPAAAAVVGGFLLANYYFTPPFHTFTIHEGENLLALLVYVAAAGIVAVLVDRVGRSRLQASRSRAEAEALAALAGAMAVPGALREMLGQVRATFGVRCAALLHEGLDGWTRAGRVGCRPAHRPGRRRRLPRARRWPRPRPRRRVAVGRRPAGAERVRRPARRRRRVATPPGRGRQGHRARPRQRPARRPAAGGVARPAHPAGGDQGGDLEPAPGGDRLAAGDREPSSRRRSSRRPTGSPPSSGTCST